MASMQTELKKALSPDVKPTTPMELLLLARPKLSRPFALSRATSGLGAAAALALSKPGFYVILGWMMATNYVGPFFLTQMLLPLLKNSPSPARIVNVSSFTHRCVFDIQVDKDTVSGKCFTGLDPYPYASMYEYTKCEQLMFRVAIYDTILRTGLGTGAGAPSVADPGVVKTNIMREVPSYVSWVAFTILRLLRILQLPKDGVSSILDAALASPETSGVYFFGGKGRTVKSSARSIVQHKTCRGALGDVV